MFTFLRQFYELDLGIALIFLGLEFLDFLICPVYYLYTSYLQLQWSASKTAANKFVARLTRLLLAFLPTPFCNNIGAITSTLYQTITTRYFFSRNFITDKNGKVAKRRTRHKIVARYRYNDLIIDDDE